MNVYDCHVHIYPEKIASRAVDAIGDFYRLSMQGEGTADRMLSGVANTPLNRFIVHSVATLPRQVASINDFIHNECEKHPEFIGFGTIHADMENGVEEVKRIKERNLHGIKIHPDTQKFDMDSPKMDEIYSLAAELHLPFLIHCGDYRYDYSHPRRLQNILHRFPKLTVIGAHFGGWSVTDLAVEFLENENCFLDTSSSIMMIGKRRAKELIRHYGAERMLFGSDFPMWEPALEYRNLLECGLTDTEMEQILSKNPERMLSI